tara:strand:- start:69 stop:320 length:252 start_codon:yes stop_codon:yes gene_type:complete
MKIQEIVETKLTEKQYIVKQVLSNRLIVTDPEQPDIDITIDLDDRMIDANGDIVIIQPRRTPNERAVLARQLLRPGVPVEIEG